MMQSQPGILSLADKLIIAAISMTDGSVKRDFTAEELVVAAWGEDQLAFGLRGFEGLHPDSNKVYTKLDGRSGLVTRGFLAKAGERRLRITEVGLARAVQLRGVTDTQLLVKLDRPLQDAISRILVHPEFKAWLADSSQPTRFRGAGHFWGVAPGTPPSTVRLRVNSVDQTLRAALKALADRGITDVVKHRGEALFERRDLERALEFQTALKTRFASELKVLDPEGTY